MRTSLGDRGWDPFRSPKAPSRVHSYEHEHSYEHKHSYEHEHSYEYKQAGKGKRLEAGADSVGFVQPKVRELFFSRDDIWRG